MEILEQLGIDPRLILVNILGFFLLLWILKKFLYRPVTDMLSTRADEIRTTYEEAELERTSMEQLRNEYETRLQGIETEAHERMQATIREARGIKDEIVSDARAKAEAAIKRGQEELARERDKTIVELRREVADLVISASSKLLEQTLDDEAHRKLIDDFIVSVGKAK